LDGKFRRSFRIPYAWANKSEAIKGPVPEDTVILVNKHTVILVTGGMEIIAIINCCGTKCLTELIKWDAVLQLCN